MALQGSLLFGGQNTVCVLISPRTHGHLGAWGGGRLLASWVASTSVGSRSSSARPGRTATVIAPFIGPPGDRAGLPAWFGRDTGAGGARRRHLPCRARSASRGVAREHRGRTAITDAVFRVVQHEHGSG